MNSVSPVTLSVHGSVFMTKGQRNVISFTGCLGLSRYHFTFFFSFYSICYIIGSSFSWETGNAFDENLNSVEFISFHFIFSIA